MTANNKELLKTVDIYTDGSCLNNPGPGGAAALLIYRCSQKTVTGYLPNTTNNQMELIAAIIGLKALNQKTIVNLYTDSKYVQQGITNWCIKWQQNNWSSASGGKVKNIGLWQELLVASGRHQVNWHWIKGHNNHHFNEKVDGLAREAAVSQQNRLIAYENI